MCTSRSFGCVAQTPSSMYTLQKSNPETTLWNAAWNMLLPGDTPNGMTVNWYCWNPPSQYAWKAVYFLSDGRMGIDQKAEARSKVEK